MMRKKNITLNGGKADGSEILKAGDEVKFFFSDETFEKFCEYVDDDAWIDYVVARALTGDGDLFNQKLLRLGRIIITWE